MNGHRWALSDYARQLDLPEPAVFCDNGVRSGSPLPRFEGLMLAAEAGLYRTVLVPGPWVFDFRADCATVLIERLTSCGVAVLELPRPGRPPKPRDRDASRPEHIGLDVPLTR
ncbi:hypothetical protein ACFXGT_29005 [Streptomyces sp. NPDC059352]|uniref:hypothetical protein n=1 Tax=Streptomyces sp. NPDC059352 TaxID=3346810 RepID=UPI003698D047